MIHLRWLSLRMDNAWPAHVGFALSLHALVRATRLAIPRCAHASGTARASGWLACRSRRMGEPPL